MNCRMCDKATIHDVIFIVCPIAMDISSRREIDQMRVDIEMKTHDHLLYAFHRECFHEVAGKEFDPLGDMYVNDKNRTR